MPKQGNKWIKKKEGKDRFLVPVSTSRILPGGPRLAQELKTIKMTNPKMLLILEGQLGFVFEGVDRAGSFLWACRLHSNGRPDVDGGLPSQDSARESQRFEYSTPCGAVGFIFLTAPGSVGPEDCQDIEETLDPALEPVLLKASPASSLKAPVNFLVLAGGLRGQQPPADQAG